MAALMNNVWLGTETGILKGVNICKKIATNYSDLKTLDKEKEITAICWTSEEEQEVLTGLRNGTVQTFDLGKGEFTEHRDCSGAKGVFKGLATYDDALITCVESGLLKVWRGMDKEATEIDVGPNICKMRQNPAKRNVVATGGKENDLKVWDLHDSEKPLFRAKNVRNDFLELRVPVCVNDMHFIPESSKIVTCTGFHHVRVYDPSTPRRRPVLSVEFDEYPLMAMGITQGGNSIVVGNTHGNMAHIDLRKGQVLRAYKGFAGSIRSIECHPSLPFVASCGLDRFLRIHHIPSGTLENKIYLKSRLNCLMFSSASFDTVDPEEVVKAQEKPVGPVDEETETIWRQMEEVTERSPKVKRKVAKDSTRSAVKRKAQAET
ncbi:WD repeat-containing protein 74-like [Acanthaster planci]|uniref:WD repeat-containing protein 74 n=1 Tax=Acanthaster planci TaxID=133434 RepID=A0A8B7YDM3_ACAPL|nr:WD repeat-containing protein 74-like [Acanthaster planci]